jgi:hypothetical protein
VTVDCPFDCEFLQEARKHDKPRQIDPDDIPNREIEVTDRFLRQNEPLLFTMSQSLLQAAAETPGCVDTDVREALAAMIKTQLTLDSGLIYESRPSNPYAGAIQQRLQAGIQQFRQEVAEQTGVNTIREKDVLGVLVFLQRIELMQNNDRSRSRAFLNFLHTNFSPPPQAEAESGPSIITPP